MRRTVTQSLDSKLSSLSFQDRLMLIKQVRDICLDHEMGALIESSKAPKQERIPECPKCGSMRTSRYGKRNGRQRHRCLDCGRMFTEGSPRNIIESSNLSRATWMAFINAFVFELPVAKCAERCGVSVPTAYYMRLRVLSTLEAARGQWRLRSGCRAQIDECYIHESFKGNRKNSEGFEMPRPAYRRARKGDYVRGRGKGMSAAEYLCVMSGVDEQRRCFLEIVGRSHPSVEECRGSLAPKLDLGCHVATDELNSYVGLLRELRVCHARYNSERTEGNLNHVNSLHSHLRAFLARKRGVSSRRLPLYLAEFEWRWENGLAGDAEVTKSKIVRSITAFDSTLAGRKISTASFPFIEWWNTPEGEKEKVRIRLARIQHGIECARLEAGDDSELLAVVDERQDALDKLVAEAKVNVKGSKAASKHPGKQSRVHMTLRMLRRT